MRQEVKSHPNSVFINLRCCTTLSTIMQFRWSTNCVLLTPRHQPGNKSLVSTYYQPWMFTLWSGSSENTLLEIVSPFQMNPPTHQFFKCSWTKPEDAPLISSPAFKYNFYDTVWASKSLFISLSKNYADGFYRSPELRRVIQMKVLAGEYLLICREISHMWCLISIISWL